jgi:hypothetical protein
VDFAAGSPFLPLSTTQEARVNIQQSIIAVASALWLCGWGTVSPVAAQAHDMMMAAPEGSFLAQSGILDLSRICAAPSARLSHLPFEGHG